MNTKVTNDLLSGHPFGVADIDSAAMTSQIEAEAGTENTKLTTALRVAQAIAALAPAGSPFAWSDHAEFHTSGRSTGELVTSLPLGPSNFRVIYSIGPITLTPDDLLIAWGEFEGTTPESVYNIGVWSQIILGTSAGDVTATTNGELTELNGRNITPSMHHDTHSKIGAVHSAVDSSVLFVNFIAYANSSSGTGPIAVEQDYGHLDVVVLKDFFA